MSDFLRISTIRDEVLGYKNDKVESGNAETVLRQVRRYARGIDRYIASGNPKDLDIVKETRDIISDVEDELIKTITEKEGPPVINPEEIKYDPEKDCLGDGAFGSVYKCQCRGKSWAVKVPKEKRLLPEKQEEFKKEITIMKKVYHPNIVLFLGASTNPIKIVTEFMPGGDLNDLIHKSGKYETLTLEKKLNIAIGIAAGMDWIHGICHISHRDLKPANILLDSNGTPKITDFGFSELTLNEDKTLNDGGDFKGTPYYMAPEIIQNGILDTSVDVYAFGIILYEIMTGRKPYIGYNDVRTFFSAVISGVRPVISPSNNVPPAISTLMTKCWDATPSARPNFGEICTVLRSSFYEALIPNEEPRAFWAENYEDDTSICFSHLCRSADKAHVDIRPIESILCDGDNSISMAHFSRLYNWFGPWFKFKEANGIIEEITSIAGKRWFHGFISGETMISRLSNNGIGTFLVRLSDTKQGYPFTISYVALKDGVVSCLNIRIKRVGFAPSVYELSGERFGSLDDVIEHCKESGVLTVECSKTPRVVAYYA